MDVRVLRAKMVNSNTDHSDHGILTSMVHGESMVRTWGAHGRGGSGPIVSGSERPCFAVAPFDSRRMSEGLMSRLAYARPSAVTYASIAVRKARSR